MADTYVAISQVARDFWMNERLTACATQQKQLGTATLIDDVAQWVTDNRHIWASSPRWGEKWTSALNLHPDDPNYEPGKDEAVITDADILATVQALGTPDA